MRNPAIAILGAGVSGLMLARRLVELGHDNIVVFEQASDVGGKCCTVDIDGRPHDLGATMGVPIDYRPVTSVSRELGIANEPFGPEKHMSLASGGQVSLNRWREMPGVLAEAARYMSLHLGRWRHIASNELHRGPASLHHPWREVVERHRLHAVSRRTLCYRAGYGYGFDDEVPGLMYANLLRPQTFLGLAVAKPFIWEGGTQPIWRGLAQRLGQRIDIRTSTPVTRIERGASGVTVHSRGRVETFDRLVVTFDPRAALSLLDANIPERRWFSQVRTYPYATFACEVSGLDHGQRSVGYLDENMVRERAGHPMAWVKRYADRDIYVFHLFAPTTLSDADIERRIALDMQRLGGRLERVVTSRRWSFFPHFTSELMQSGGLDEIDRWQGQTGVYLIGEVLSFATMARVAGHATGFAERIARELSVARQPHSVSAPIRRAS